MAVLRISWLLVAWMVLSWVPGVEAATNEVSVVKNLPYKPEAGLSDYERERCQLDLYLPAGKTNYPTLVWFHGGGLTGGTKNDGFNVRIAQRLAQAGLGIAMAGYRLSPKAKYPSYIDDTAAAFAWVRRHIVEHGGDPQRVFIGGHSAGGYLTLMVCLDRQYLGRWGLDTTAIAGAIPVSGQTLTHYTIREERGLNKDILFADEAAPIHHVRKDAPPMLVLFAERDMAARAEENQLLVAALRAAGHPRILDQLIRDRDHGSIAEYIARPGDPVAEAILAFVGLGGSQPGAGAGAEGARSAKPAGR